MLAGVTACEPVAMLAAIVVLAPVTTPVLLRKYPLRIWRFSQPFIASDGFIIEMKPHWPSKLRLPRDPKLGAAGTCTLESGEAAVNVTAAESPRRAQNGV